MKWEKYKLENIVTFKTGKLNSNAAIENGTYPFFTCSKEVYRTNTTAFNTEAVLLGGNNAVGDYPLFYFNGEFDAYQRTYIIEPLDLNTLNIRFLYYNLRPRLKDFQNYSTGASTKFLTLKILNSVEVNLPPLSTQRKIASILSAYDDLIENNLKRIKLLEEKAQLHYKELMQEMSYSKTKREEYIKNCLAFYIGGGWGEEDYKEKFTEPAYVIRGTDIPDTRGGNVLGIPLRFHKVSNLESRKMQAGDIVFEISNGQINNIGRTVLISKRLLGQFDQPVMCASFAKLIRVNEKVSPEYFYLYLNEGQENGLLYQYKSNSANGINNFAFETFIDEVKITIPKETELKGFTEKVKPIFTLISTLGEQNSKLREARDILLPKLMSGQIQV